jgi:hypothetical protein
MNSQHITFYTKLDKVTLACISTYLKNLTPLDKHVRNITLYETYIKTFVNDSQQKIITEDINNIDYLTSNLYPIFYNIPWKICLLEKDIENNFPHTHNDVIFLPYNFEKLNKKIRRQILTHEKIHVFQRYYPEKTLTLYLEVWKLRVVNILGCNSEYGENNSSINMIRSNPDINKLCFAFYHPERDSFCHFSQIYKTGASKLSHSESILYNVDESFLSKSTYSKNLRYYTHVQHLIETNEQYEHPNETMACLLTTFFLYEDLPDTFTKSWAILSFT